jgi:hypothetical protein
VDKFLSTQNYYVDEKAVTKLGLKAFRTWLATDIFYYFFFLIVISCKRASEIGECPKEKKLGALKGLNFLGMLSIYTNSDIGKHI